jgi:hypothetical protein
MTALLAVYAGDSVADARLIAVSSDAELVAYVTERLLRSPDKPADPAAARLEQGRRGALRLLQREALDARR